MKDKLIEKLREGDPHAFEMIMTRYMGYVCAVVRNHSHDVLTPEDVEELTVDTFTALWQNRERITPDRPLMPYLAVTARNKTLNRLRSVRLTDDIDEIVIPSDSFESSVEKKYVIEDILTSAEKLGQRQREIFIRYYIYGETLDTIAENLQLSPANARTTLFRAREAVKKMMSERGYNDE